AAAPGARPGVRVAAECAAGLGGWAATPAAAGGRDRGGSPARVPAAGSADGARARGPAADSGSHREMYVPTGHGHRSQPRCPASSA
ncbi:hypothetical protein E4P42_26635, partial [Mycobacterium sp. PS03-16]